MYDPYHLNNFSFLKALEAVYEIWIAIGPVISEEKSFEIVDGRRTDRRTTEPAYTISSPGAFGSGELKMKERKKNDISYQADFLNSK